MFKRMKSLLFSKPSRPAPSEPAPTEPAKEGGGVDLCDLSEQLFEIAGELDVIMTASQITEFHESEAFGLYLILRRQIKRIRAINDALCAEG